jgi:hypothetical protein
MNTQGKPFIFSGKHFHPPGKVIIIASRYDRVFFGKKVLRKPDKSAKLLDLGPKKRLSSRKIKRRNS